ncbi:DUF4468 domain-containing protein [Acinetobacter pittii]|uniref:DUF4468 domain-containing protein n=1 Tax=Acinetobacter pittii TaxID=48296 RepID=UPI0008396712|nr:DUF4468 domain-containing protein [Acinetobacter pittii]MBN6492793.1 DUF4468 domain-containing protein [Acinetobacter pittii]OCY50782.1 hypothetical protein BFR81_12125 [Acinetobacter pittii]
MKRILLLGLMILNTSIYAEKEPLKEVSEVVELPNMTQKQIYDSSKIWIAKSFKSANSVIQYEDASTGTIIGKGNMNYPCKGAWNCMANAENLILFTVKVDTKDNKARITFNDLLLKTKTTVNAGIVAKGFEVGIYVPKDKEMVETGLRDIISKYQKDIQNQKDDSNW